MQISGQDQNRITPTQVQYNSNYSSGAVAPVSPQCSVPQVQYVQNPNPAQYPYNNPQYYYPQPQYIQQPQNVQVPAGAAGVNIQIFNPSVTTPGSMGPTYNVNAPSYPAGYYTGQYPTCSQPNPNTQVSTDSTKTTSAEQTQTETSAKKKETKRVVLIDDNYIKSLENCLNSQDKSIRLNAAKNVFERLDEDPSRKDDKALTALVNKMLQDPSQEIRLIALSALEGRIVNGDDITVQILQHIQSNPQGQGFDAADASKILLDMAGKRVDKEVEIDPDKRTKIKTEKKEEEKKSAIKKK